jgi:hypothetical protein
MVKLLIIIIRADVTRGVIEIVGSELKKGSWHRLSCCSWRLVGPMPAFGGDGSGGWTARTATRAPVAGQEARAVQRRMSGCENRTTRGDDKKEKDGSAPSHLRWQAS